MWLFTYYAAGMNLADVLRLKYKDIENGFLSFVRTKIVNTQRREKRVEIYLSSAAQNIIERWGCSDRSPERYVFDVLKEGMSEREKFKEVHLYTRSINQYLERIAPYFGWKQLSFATNRYVSQRKVEALERLRAVCASALQASSSKRDFYSRLNRASVRVEQVRSQKGGGSKQGRVVGQRFWFEGYSYKASEVDRGYSLRSLNARFSNEVGLSWAAARALNSGCLSKTVCPKSVLQQIAVLGPVATVPQPVLRHVEQEEELEKQSQQTL